MTKRSDERRNFLSSVITTAVEGGTGYWAQVSDYGYWHEDHDADYDEYAVLHELVPDPDDPGPDGVLEGGSDWSGWYSAKGLRLDIEGVASAVQKIIRGEAKSENYRTGGDPLGEYAVKTIKEASDENDGGMIDADMADLIAQVALLGIVRYG